MFCGNWTFNLLNPHLSNQNLKLTMIYKFRMVARAASAKTITQALVRYTDRWHASLRLNCTIIHLICACAPKIVRCTAFLYCLPLDSESLWGLVHSSNWRGFDTASKTTSALIQFSFIYIYKKILAERYTKFVARTNSVGISMKNKTSAS